ncbi:fucose isomerase [Herbiconiux moechotypicola]|uniref:L-fucose/L-arabinose isomerase family protein n=1 Tax=Herbiconiux moechotypicola TaxID=637393 RepID=A0ABN3DQU3_9MICO|nr:fucose isomerase [Herbiconiux moechotypicola]MCS5731423.1 fucose isomerase [Herbiconiux moechotypicola]
MTTSYTLPTVADRGTVAPKTAYLLASGDLRESANTAGWPTQVALEAAITGALAELGWSVVRANPVDPATGHGFISSQRMGLEVFKSIPADAPLIVAEAVWQYSHHVLAGLRTHRGPILTAANFAGDWPGLVGLLGLNAGLTKMGTPYSTVWSVDFTDDWARDRVREWVETGRIVHDDSHVHPLPSLDELAASGESDTAAGAAVELGTALAHQLQTDKAIIGVFDEGCMGMYNAIIDDELLNTLGIYKERLSQSALFAEMQRVDDAEAEAVGRWLAEAGMTFVTGTDEATELTERQLIEQHKMYIAALRISDDFGLDAVGIQYQQGLKDLTPASDLPEGLLNNVERPPVTSRDGSRVLWEGQALPHFNEADEGVAADALVTNRVWTAMGLDPATTLHDVRWGEDYDGRFVWVYEISGSVPPSHFENGYADAVGWRQDPVFFPAGGSTIKGVSKPGEIVWSRLYVQGGALHLDIGRASAVALPAEETERRWQATNPEWPIMHVVLHGISRDQFMARHKANHAQVAYAPTAAEADAALLAKATVFAALGVQVHLCGDVAVPGVGAGVAGASGAGA